MDRLINFLETPNGRMLRLLAGFALVGLGYIFVKGVVGALLMLVGFVPVFTAIIGVCLIAPQGLRQAHATRAAETPSQREREPRTSDRA